MLNICIIYYGVLKIMTHNMRHIFSLANDMTSDYTINGKIVGEHNMS